MPSQPVPTVTLLSVQERLAPAGLNLVGATTAEDFDRSQPAGKRVHEVAPDCGTVVVVASGGREFWERMQAESDARSRPLDGGHQPIADRCARLGSEVRAWLGAQGIRATLVCPTRNPALNFVQMAETAGLGVVSPVADWLMHPSYGPWVSVRFALLLDGAPLGTAFQRQAGEYQPCAGCHRPCVGACPGDACAGGAFAIQRCAAHRHGGGCTFGCYMKQACPAGVDHRYADAEQRARQANSLLALQRQFGLGWWKLVPKSMRPGG